MRGGEGGREGRRDGSDGSGRQTDVRWQARCRCRKERQVDRRRRGRGHWDWLEATSKERVSLSGGAAKNITESNRGYDVGPVYSADGRYILYRSQATPGFEADRWR